MTSKWKRMLPMIAFLLTVSLVSVIWFASHATDRNSGIFLTLAVISFSCFVRFVLANYRG